VFDREFVGKMFAELAEVAVGVGGGDGGGGFALWFGLWFPWG